MLEFLSILIFLSIFGYVIKKEYDLSGNLVSGISQGFFIALSTSMLFYYLTHLHLI